MASVDFCELILHDGADLTDRMSFPTLNSLTAGLETPGEVRRYANGTTRLITRAGASRTARARLPLLNRDRVVWLEGHARRLLLIRDGQGRVFFGAYFSPSFDELGFIDEAGTELVFNEISHSVYA